MATHKTLTGRSRNSTIPRAIVEVRKDMYLAELEKGTVEMIRRMGPETEQVDVLVEDQLTYLGILRDIQAQGLSVEMQLINRKPELVTVEVRKDNTFRVSRKKKLPPGLIPPPLKKR